MCPGWRDLVLSQNGSHCGSGDSLSDSFFLTLSTKFSMYPNGISPFNVRAKLRSPMCKKESQQVQCGRISSPAQSRSAALNRLPTLEKGDAESHMTPGHVYEMAQVQQVCSWSQGRHHGTWQGGSIKELKHNWGIPKSSYECQSHSQCCGVWQLPHKQQARFYLETVLPRIFVVS